MENTQGLTTAVLKKISIKTSNLDSSDIQIDGYTADDIINQLKVCIKDGLVSYSKMMADESGKTVLISNINLTPFGKRQLPTLL